MWKKRSNPIILKEIGTRIRQIRLRLDITQRSLSDRSGVSLNVIQRLEKGSAVSTMNLISVLRELDLPENLDALLPLPEISPTLSIRPSGDERKRASKNQ